MADDKRDCANHQEQDLRIKVCAAVIARDPEDAIAYHNRGVAYQSKGDLGRAIADYNRVIELKPTYAPAYDSRGRAYASTGDYTRAVADMTKARELIPQPSPRQRAITPARPTKKRVVAGAKSSVTYELFKDEAWPAWAAPATKLAY